jgi:hypothetical protein
MRKDLADNPVQQEAAAAISAAHLLHPAEHFDHPRDVLAADGIGDEEKRAILASWASDIFAVKSIPALRLYPGTNKAVSYDEIIEALKTLDKGDARAAVHGSPASFNARRATYRRRPQMRRLGGLGLCSYRKGGRRRQPFEI